MKNKINIKRIYKNVLHSPLFVLYLIICVYLVGSIYTGFNVYKKHDLNPSILRLLSIYPFPVATVNGEIILVSELNKQTTFIEQFKSVSGQDVGSQDDIRNKLVDRMIEDTLIFQEARKMSVSVTDKEVDDNFNKIASEQGGKEVVLRYLNEFHKISEEDFKKLIKIQIIRKKIQDDKIDHIKIKHILVSTEDQAKSTISDINNNKITFENAASKYSKDVASSSNGGQITYSCDSASSATCDKEYIARGSLPKDFEDQVFVDTIPLGKTYDQPIKSSQGFHIIRVDARKGDIHMSFDDLIKNIQSKSRIRKYY